MFIKIVRHWVSYLLTAARQFDQPAGRANQENVIIMKPRRRVPPIWLIGLSNSTFGLYGGFITFSLPQLLAEQHVPEARIAAICAAVTSPGFYAFLLSPMLDVRFSRRTYATIFAGLAAALLTIGVLNLTHPDVLEGALLLGFVAACLFTSALGGWLSTVSPKEEETRLSSWFNVANIGAGGVMALIGAELIHYFSNWIAALLLGMLIFLPACIFLLVPAPGPDRRLARESFPVFFREVFSLLRRRPVLIAMLLFAAPASTFALTNILGGLGNDFHCTAWLVSLMGGVGMTFAGIFGSLLFPALAKRWELRRLYLGIGAAGCLFTLILILLPHSPGTFGLAYIGENIFQSLAFTGVFAIAFETIGQDNPLAATTFSLLNAAAILPLVYMQVVDGRAYSASGVAGSYLADGLTGLAACFLLMLVLAKFTSRTRPSLELL